MLHRRPRPAWTSGLLTAVVVTGALIAATPTQAVTGGATADEAYAFTAKLDIGNGTRSCSAVLVDAQWLATAASCFADNPAQGLKVSAGAPKLKTTATIGRTDLAKGGGSVADVVELVPRGDRDLVLAKLAKPATGIAPTPVGATALRQGEDLTVSGYGRTKDQWVPNRLHSAKFSLQAVQDTSASIAGASDGAAVCAGDTGGPVLREHEGRYELAGVSSRSWQGSCFGNEDEKRNGAVIARTDDVAGWIQQIRLSTLVPDVTSVLTTADFNGDGRTDVAAVTKDGDLHAFYGRTDGTFEYGRPLWAQDGGWKGITKIIGGDFNGDGHADIAAVWGNGSLRFYAGDSKGTLAPNKPMWVDEKTDWNDMLQLVRFKSGTSNRDGLLAVWGGGPKGALYAYDAGPSGALNGTKRNMWRDASWQHMKKIATGDFNGDGRDDIVSVTNVGGLTRYTRYDSAAGGGLSEGVSMWHDNGWSGTQILLAGDFDGDGNTDVGSLWSNQQRFNFYKGDGKGNIATGTHAWPRDF
ncbi:esterase [Streptomyces sp. WAC 06725]|uniref:trypsin-like serine protease n=1 Tax=Streptomyces sp. WAC 06725 TaxID=2203209 RepID=UPI000F737243|nr:trypsin-like serine protease [Streptomyces sp. WAC 06725]RSO44262.1 esterase [Streptomyces sp. WAC 06725]